jgi:hypothetical protein
MNDFEKPSPKPMAHILKILPEYFEAVRSGKKTAEYRENDRDFQVGDVLILAEDHYGEYTGRIIYKKISHITETVKFDSRRDCVMLSLESGECEEGPQMIENAFLDRAKLKAADSCYTCKHGCCEWGKVGYCKHPLLQSKFFSVAPHQICLFWKRNRENENEHR